MGDTREINLIKVIISIQLALLGIIGFDVLGIKIDIIRCLIGFVYLTFVPGMLLIIILRLTKLEFPDIILHSIGLSLFTLMLSGFMINMVGLYIGVSRPISLPPLISTLSIIILSLTAICYLFRENCVYFSKPKLTISRPSQFLILILFLTIFGTYYQNNAHSNVLLILLIFVLSIIPLMVAFDIFINENLYPFAIFIAAISLLYHVSLISEYTTGWDIQLELYFANSIDMNSFWSPTISNNINSMLSSVMLAPIYSIVLNLNTIWVLKIIYPCLYSLIPVGLYLIFKRQSNEKSAFLACYFFITYFIFYTGLTQLPRQGIAELFLVLIILSIITFPNSMIQKSILLIIYGFSIVVSHYAISYIFLGCLIFSYLATFLFNNFVIKGIKSINKFENIYNIKSIDMDKAIKSSFIIWFAILAFSWYIYNSSSSVFITILQVGSHISGNLFTDFLNPKAAEGLGLILQNPESLLHNISKYMHLVTQALIAIGLVQVLLFTKTLKFNNNYKLFSIYGIGLCFCAIVLPFFGRALNTSRLYQISLIFLAIYFIIGWDVIFKQTKKVIKFKSPKPYFKSLGLFLSIYLLINSGLIYEIANDYPISISLNNSIDYPRFNEKEITAGKWLESNKNNETLIFSDDYRGLLFLGILGNYNVFFGEEYITNFIPESVYVFLGRENTQENKIILVGYNFKRNSIALNNSKLFDHIRNTGKIYNNDDSKIFYR